MIMQQSYTIYKRGSLDESETIGLYDLALNDTTEFKATYEKLKMWLK